jgi:hypothetical protein
MRSNYRRLQRSVVVIKINVVAIEFRRVTGARFLNAGQRASHGSVLQPSHTRHRLRAHTLSERQRIARVRPSPLPKSCAPAPPNAAVSQLLTPRCSHRYSPRARAKDMLDFDSTIEVSERTAETPALRRRRLLRCRLPLGPHVTRAGASSCRHRAPRYAANHLRRWRSSHSNQRCTLSVGPLGSAALRALSARGAQDPTREFHGQRVIGAISRIAFVSKQCSHFITTTERWTWSLPTNHRACVFQTFSSQTRHKATSAPHGGVQPQNSKAHQPRRVGEGPDQDTSAPTNKKALRAPRKSRCLSTPPVQPHCSRSWLMMACGDMAFGRVYAGTPSARPSSLLTGRTPSGCR